MTVKEIAGVRELTAQECTKINGGTVDMIPIGRLYKYLFDALNINGLIGAIANLFS